MPVGYRRNLSTVFSLLTAVFVALSIVAAIYSLSALRFLSVATYDESGIAAVQLRMHYSLMLSELRHLEQSGDSATVPEAQLQYNIVYQRLRELPGRPPYDEILTKRELDLLEAVFADVRAEADRIDAATPEAPEVLYGIGERLAPNLDKIALLSGRIHQLFSEYRQHRREEISASTRFMVISTAGLILTGMIFAGLLWRSQQSLRNRTVDLERTRDELLEASRSKSQFLAHMSHELRTPLNAISGFSEMIERKAFGDNIDPRYIEYAKMIHSSGNHLISIINDVLDLSKVEAGQVVVSIKTIDLRIAINESLRLVDFRRKQNADQISVSIAEDASILHTDPRLLRQVLINLVHNADKYTPAENRIRVTSERNDRGDIVISVSDEGVGIGPEDLERVLEPFGQGRSHVEIAHQGTGLGLSLSKMLIELLGGRFELESEVGVGTTARLIFPSESPISEDQN